MRKNGLPFYKKMLKRLRAFIGFSLTKKSTSLDLLYHRKWSKGDLHVTSFIFLFILIGTLRLCNTRTLHEAKLTGIFIQETQGFYLLENLMHLARDYVYQIVQNPREPHLFLSVSSFREKEKLAPASSMMS